jgi:nicotinate-nucleotide pyrophosphorylase (carboxylating)
MHELQTLNIDPVRFHRLVELAREEDLGRWGDITTKLAAVSPHHEARLVCRQEAVICGLPLVSHILEMFPIPPGFRPADLSDGQRITAGTTLGSLIGPAGAATNWA